MQEPGPESDLNKTELVMRRARGRDKKSNPWGFGLAEFACTRNPASMSTNTSIGRNWLRQAHTLAFSVPVATSLAVDGF
ncbi:hypothetical protein P8C59_004031 [Phyllachora maydis]|uniref:Uncharacterized protein n=1 Tax=Phyllachora maydis TaxID=1825666 RepID=A0AAD9M9X9_9PEZI|nr:hypothetical protein P8C59_004031 [Phyllachora maydis]